MKRIVPFILIIGLIVGLFAFHPMSTPIEKSTDQKVDSLLALMTLEEKVGQLNMYNGTWEFTGPVPADANSQDKAEMIKNGQVGAMLNVLTAEGTYEAQKLAVENSRLGIPLLFGYDVIHGYKTMFPIPLGQAASWDANVGQRSSRIAAEEMSSTGLHWAFGPMIDVARDARWGRIMECAGEDPLLNAYFAKAWIEGLQGDDLSELHTVAACAKHFAAYGFVEAGLDYFSVDISDQTMFNVALPPFKAAVESGVSSVMNAFQDINGIPATAHKFLMRETLKGVWGFEGLVLSDWASINELIPHGYAKDRKAAAKLAFEAGCDMDMEAKVYEEELAQLIEKGSVDIALLDDAVKRILKLKFELGLFDDPYRYSNKEREQTSLLTKENLAAAREVGSSSIVLLKNDKNLLPLAKKGKSIAVIGQLGKSKDVVLGSWRAQAVSNSGVSILEGVQNATDNSSQVKYAQGYTLTKGDRAFIYELDIVEGDRSKFPEAVQLARESDVVVLAMGEDCYQSGEGRSQVDITLKGNQEELFEEILKVNKNVVVVLMNGRPLAIPGIAEKAPAILETWFLGSEMGNSVADVLFGDVNPSGKLPVSFPHHVGQEPFYYNKKNSGRPVPNDFDAGMVFWGHYTDGPKEAVFPFGHGLSYSTFKYKNLEVEPKTGEAKVSVQVKNTSSTDGVETVQVYIWDRFATETQPIKRLVDFKKVMVKAGETTSVQFTLNEEDLGFYHRDYQFYAEDGEFRVMVGSSSEDYLAKDVSIEF